MPDIEKIIPSDLINTDITPDKLPQTAAVNLRNIRFHKSVDGKAFRFENIMRNMKLTGQEGKIPAGSERIAEFEDPAGNFVIWFTHKEGSPGDDQINYYDLKEGKYWLVAKSNMSDGGAIVGGLGFKFGTYYELDAANGTLYWVSKDHEPRKIHLGAGIRACQPTEEDSPFYDGWKYDWVSTGSNDTGVENLSLAVKPSAYPPMIVKRSDSTVSSNNLTGDSYKFATQLTYYSKEEPVLSMFSQGSMINSEAERVKNVIDVSVNPLEFPLPQGVKAIRLCVKVESTQKVYIVHTWKKEDIEAGGLLTYKFYGNYYGEFIADAKANEPFHSVPENAEAQAIIKNRLFLGNCIEGKDTPEKTSMTLTVGEPTDINDLTHARKKLQRVMYRGKRKNGLSRPRFYYSGLYLKLDEVPVPGYYLIPNTEIRMGAGYVGVPAIFTPSPATVNLEDLVFKGKTLSEIIEATRSVTIAELYESYIQESPAITVQVIGLTPSGDIGASSVFLYNSDYTAAMNFYDRYLRKCGAITNPAIKASIPTRKFDADKAYTDIRWALSNNDALNEIPADAVYYAPLLTRSSRTAVFFVEGCASETRYATIDPDGTYKFDDGKADDDVANDDTPYLVYSIAAAAIAIENTSLLNVGLGYNFNKGDMCILTDQSDVVHHVPVIGTDGKYILLAAKDIGNLEDKKFIFQIYTPFKAESQDFFNEVGQLYPVSEAGTDQRKYSAVGGSFLPDVYVIQRKNGASSSYLAYAMSPNDLYYEKWYNHFGRTNVVLELGRRHKFGNVSFSDVFIAGTAINGMNAFHAVNEENLPPELGPIRKLQIATKVQGEGSLLLAICESGTASLYIGESEIFDQSGNSFLAKSDKVIGQVNPLKGGYGTLHPESVRQDNGLVFWFNMSKRAFVQYAGNGLVQISNYGFATATHKICEKIKTLQASGKEVMMNGGIDPVFKEYLVQMKQYTAEVIAECPIPSAIIVSYVGSVVTAAWTQSAENPNYQWSIFDSQGYSVASGAGSGSGSVSIEVDYLDTGVNYSFRLRTSCGGNNYSSWRNAVIYIVGVEVPPAGGSGCVGLSFVDAPVLRFPDAIVGEYYEQTFILEGSIPATMNVTNKPEWLSIVMMGDSRTIRLSGDPTFDDVEPNVNVNITFTNCAGSVAFSKLLTTHVP